MRLLQPSSRRFEPQESGIQGETPVHEEARDTIVFMPGAPAPPRIEIPRWVQLVGLPLLLVLAWVVAGAVRHVVFIFLVALLIALLLNPLVRGLGRVWIPRGLAVSGICFPFAAPLTPAVNPPPTPARPHTR